LDASDELAAAILIALTTRAQSAQAAARGHDDNGRNPARRPIAIDCDSACPATNISKEVILRAPFASGTRGLYDIEWV